VAREQAYASRPGLEVDLAEGVLRLRLDRPDKRNAVDDEMMLGLVESVSAAEEDEAVRVIVIAGTGDHFCSGADIVARNAGDERPRVGSIQRRVPHQAHRLTSLLCSVQVPVVCVVRGWAAGLGFQIALAADVTLAATDATFWEPFVARGFTPDSGASWLLHRRVGPVRARELLLLGRRLSGSEAAEWGLIHAAHPDEALDAEVAEIVDRLASGPTVALGLTKWLLHEAGSTSLDESMRQEAFGLELSSRSEDFREGFAAFREKRAPEFRGR
jgi:2-(1,2-epoxy-1,2-dihydrophenyl)acetyl-CoA isomerase